MEVEIKKSKRCKSYFTTKSLIRSHYSLKYVSEKFTRVFSFTVCTKSPPVFPMFSWKNAVQILLYFFPFPPPQPLLLLIILVALVHVAGSCCLGRYSVSSLEEAGCPHLQRQTPVHSFKNCLSRRRKYYAIQNRQ